MVLEARVNSDFSFERGRSLSSGISVIDLMEVSGTITSSDGVPLASDRVDESLNTLSDGTKRDFEYRPYDKPTHVINETSSRYPNGHPHELPISGLEERRFHEHYRSMLRTMITLRHAYILQTSNPDTNRQLTASEMQHLLAGLMYLPQYLVLRARNPQEPQNTLHPSLTILSNAASGSLGATDGWINYQKKLGVEREEALGMIPDANLMINQVEEVGGMIGKRTICPIRPPRQRQFLSSVRDGASVVDARGDTFDIETVLDMSEVKNVIIFGSAAYPAKGLGDIFSGVDKKVAGEIKKDIEKGRDRRVKQAVSRYHETAAEHNAKVTQYQMQMNRALGRDTRLGVTLDSFERVGFEMPKIMRDLKEKDGGRGKIYPVFIQRPIAIPVVLQ